MSDAVLESFSGGLVTARDIALLQPGELTKCRNATYRPYSLSLQHAVGRAQAGLLGSGNITGLGALTFDNGNNYLLIQNATELDKAVVSSAFALSSQTSLGAYGTQGFDLVRFQDKYYLLFGDRDNIVINSSLAIRAHGLQPVTNRLALRIVTGVWPLGTAGINLFYEYWFTEVMKTATEELESDADPTSVVTTPTPITSIEQAVEISIPNPPINPTATHFRLYRSVGKTFFNDKVFPSGLQIAEIPVGGAGIFVDGSATAPSYAFPPSGNCTTVAGNWINPTRVAAADSSEATTVPSGTAGVFSDNLKTTNYTLGTLIDPVVGIEVEINSRVTQGSGNYGELVVNLSIDAGATFKAYKYVPKTQGLVTHTLGGPTDLWGTTWSAADFGSNFSLHLRATRTAGSPTMGVDWVRVRVYTNGTPAGSSVPFPAIQVNINGVNSSVGENGAPPRASTGDIFEGCMVTDDVAHPNVVAYSVPGKIESFSPLYTLKPDAKGGITCIRTVGNRIVVGIGNTLQRVNFLANEDDSTFNGLRAVDEIDSTRGIANRSCAKLFPGPDGRNELAFVTRQGQLLATDGFTIRELCPDIDYATLVEPATYAQWSLINNTSLQELVFYYVPQGSATVDEKIHFAYGQQHLKNGNTLKASGPVAANNIGVSIGTGQATAVAAFPLLTGPVGVYTGYSNGKVTLDTGTTITNTSDTLAEIITRRIVHAGFGGEWILNEIYLQHNASGGTWNVTPWWTKTGSAENTTDTAKTLTFSFDGLSRLTFRRACEGVRLRFREASTTTPFNLPYFAFIPSAPSKEDSKKAG